MRERRNLSTFLALALFAAFLGAFAPFWPIGRRIDDAGAAFAFKRRRPPALSPRVTLVEIDDISVEALGPWPWDAATVRKLFEAPFCITEMTVSLVSPGDFRADRRAGEAFYKGLSNLESASAAYAYQTEEVPLEIVSLLAETPAAGQAVILREPMLPRWRALALRGIVARAYRARPEATEEEMVERVVGPFWRDSVEVADLAHFWYGQVVGRRAFHERAEMAGFDAANFERLAEEDDLYLPPVSMIEPAHGVAGPAGRGDFPAVPAFVMHRARPAPRVSLSVAEGLDGFSRMHLEGRRLVIESATGSDWSVELDDAGGLIPNWTGNGETPWDAPFVHRLSAAALVEAANARRAAWEGYRQFEAEIGMDRMTALVGRYEQAVDAGDPDAIIDAERDITANLRRLLDIIEEDGAQAAGMDPARIDYYRSTILELNDAFTGLVNGIVAYFTQAGNGFTDKVILIAPTAREFRTMKTPWGEDVSPAALEAAILNSVLTGETIRRAPVSLAAAFIAAGALLALAAGRYGGARSSPAALAILGASAYAWFALLDSRGILAGLYPVAAAGAGYLGGAAVFHAVVGRRRRRAKRLLRARVARSRLSKPSSALESLLFRQVDEAAVLAVEISPSGGIDVPEIRRRYRRQAAQTMRENGAVLLDSASEIEGAFGWFEDQAGPLEMAVFSGLAARRRLGLLGEKLRAGGESDFSLRMGLGIGRGELADATIGLSGLRTSGESFEKARVALGAAGRFMAGIVITAEDRETVERSCEMRKLDAGGGFFEIIEKRGTVPLAVREVMDLYEAALEAEERGETRQAAKLARQAVDLAGDGPSRVLLRRLEADSQGASE